MKSILILVILFLAFGTQAQTRSIDPVKKYEGTVEFQKTKQPCTILEFNYPADDVENGLEEYAKKSGAHMSSTKGWTVAKGARLENRGNKYFDVYYKVEGKGKGDNAKSTVYMILAEPGENIIARPTTAEGIAVGTVVVSGAVVGGMGDQLGEYDLNKRIAAQESELKSAQKKYDNLVDDGKSLETKRQKLEKEITDNQTALTTQQQELERLKGLLEQLKGKKN